MANILNYTSALYRKDNNGNITFWNAETQDFSIIHIQHGRLDGHPIDEYIKTHRNPSDEINSRRNAKRKTGYKFLSELKDNVELPSINSLQSFLEAYLPAIRTTADGSTLAMLAKSFDKANNIFKKVNDYFGQYKINGLRCFIRAEESVGLFSSYHLTFQSREGTYWDSLNYLEQQLLELIPKDLLELMAHEDYVLDGELYIPGYTVNEINSAVKNETNPLNKNLQYWCYDLAIEDTAQYKRFEILDSYLASYIEDPLNKDQHLNIRKPLVYLPRYLVDTELDARNKRDLFISLGFEGLIMRAPEEEYQFGKRNMSMLKYKRSTDGKFLILDIYPEGEKRDIPLFKLKNDINDETFEVHINGDFDYQRSFLRDEQKEKVIGKYMYVEYGERSGINQVPFHCKAVRLYEGTPK